MKKSVFGLDENHVGALSYVGLFVTGIIVLVLEKENKFVRFHALQSTIWFVFLSILGWVLNILSGIWLIGSLIGFIAWVVGVVCFASWIFLIVMAVKGDTFRLPVIGDVVWNQINK